MKKYIISIIVLISICFISFSVSAVEYQTNEEILNPEEKAEKEFLLNNEESLQLTAETLRDSLLNRESDIYITVETINLNHRWISARDVFDMVYEKAVSEELSINSSSRSIFEVVYKKLVL